MLVRIAQSRLNSLNHDLSVEPPWVVVGDGANAGPLLARCIYICALFFLALLYANHSTTQTQALHLSTNKQVLTQQYGPGFSISLVIGLLKIEKLMARLK